MTEEKISTGIILPIETMECLDEMARDDRRDRSAEIRVLVEQEWKRRHPEQQAESSTRKAGR
jgi:metal-responsive CopG/Arc/MetJ family transcriptional regulator